MTGKRIPLGRKHIKSGDIFEVKLDGELHGYAILAFINPSGTHSSNQVNLIFLHDGSSLGNGIPVEYCIAEDGSGWEIPESFLVEKSEEIGGEWTITAVGRAGKIGVE